MSWVGVDPVCCCCVVVVFLFCFSWCVCGGFFLFLFLFVCFFLMNEPLCVRHGSVGTRGVL